jgi:nucleotide-binding universal stress UspA family protein
LKKTETNFKLFFLGCLILAIAFFHFGTPATIMQLHLVLQTLFFVPVVLAGLWFGRKGGLLSAGTITVLYAHHAITVMMPTPEMAVSNGIQLVLLFVAGFLSGAYTESRRRSNRPLRKSHARQRLLFYVDETPAAINAARHVASMVPPGAGTEVTLLGVVNTAQPENLLQDTGGCQEHQNRLDSLQGAAEETRDLLIENGFSRDSISMRFANSPGGRISDTILNEQRSGKYTAIVIGRPNLDSDDSITSSVAASLARRASCPVWVIAEE